MFFISHYLQENLNLRLLYVESTRSVNKRCNEIFYLIFLKVIEFNFLGFFHQFLNLTFLEHRREVDPFFRFKSV